MSSTSQKRPPLFGAVIGFGMGLFFLGLGLNRPSIATMRTVDLVHLVASGALLGVGLTSLFMYFVFRRKG